MVEVEEKQAIFDVNEVRTPIKMIFYILGKINFIKVVSSEPGMQSYVLDSAR